MRNPLDRIDAGPRPAAVGRDFEPRIRGLATVRNTTGIHGQHEHLTTEPIGDLGDQCRPRYRRGIDAHLVRSGAQQPIDIVDRSDPTADSQRDEHLFGGTRHDVVHRGPIRTRRGDVHERQFVGTGRPVRRSQLHRCPRIAQVGDVHPSDHPPGCVFEAWDHPYRDTHPATLSASSRVNAPAYNALPTIAPSTPADTSDRNAAMSSSVDTPPLATTGRSVQAHTWGSRSRLGPRRVPSLVTSVTT